MKSEPERMRHAESKDSLVTQSLLNLTSYDTQDEQDRDVGDAKTTLHRGDILLSSAILDDPGHENRMSFDDLEQVYKNISRRKILNKVKEHKSTLVVPKYFSVLGTYEISNLATSI